MIDAASGGSVTFSAAHTFQDPGYWGRYGGDFIGAECLADYGGSAICNEVEYRLMRDLFPDTTTAMDKLLEVMANG